jgi:diguanylate cyclase (GGDEF)-like protein
LSVEWARAVRSKLPLSIIMLDVDFFKRFNDRYGHQAGDDCLRQIASTLKSCLKRPADLVARYGGEEFACILPDTRFDDAMVLATNMERRVREQEIAHENSGVAPMVTVSIGLATLAEDCDGGALALVGLADTQLYNAKQSGRGRVGGAILQGSATRQMPVHDGA